MEDMRAKSCFSNTHFFKILTESTLACVNQALEVKCNDRVTIIKRNKKLQDGDFTIILPQSLKSDSKEHPHGSDTCYNFVSDNMS